MSHIAHELEVLIRKLADADVFSGTVLLAKDGVPIFKGALDMFLGTGWTAAVMSNYSMGAQPVQQKMRDLVRADLEMPSVVLSK